MNDHKVAIDGVNRYAWNEPTPNGFNYCVRKN